MQSVSVSAMTLRIGGDLFKIKTPRGSSLQTEDRVGLKLTEDDFTLFDADEGDVM